MSGELATGETTLDELLAALQHCRLSPLELRILIRVAAHPAAQSELADALHARPKKISRVVRRLAMRGLIARRFDGGPRSCFVLSITSSGLQAVAPLIARAAPTPAR